MEPNTPQRRYKILFVCTGNCCRSQMAEALLRHVGGKQFDVRSAGTNPAGYVHPLVVEAMQRLHIPLDGQFSKSWNDFENEPQDIIITLCDYAASVLPPDWAGQPVLAHWSLPDPSHAPGTDDDRLKATLTLARQLRKSLEELSKLPLDELMPRQLETELLRIGP